MTDAELTELEQAARAATPGPWHIKRGYCLYDERDMHVVSAWENYSGSKEMSIDCEEAYANARFLELTNPAAILELIAELRQTKAELKRIKIEHMKLSWENHDLCERFGLIREGVTWKS